MGCNYLSLSEIPASSTKVLISALIWFPQGRSTFSIQLIVLQWRHMTSVIVINIGSGTGQSPFRCQTITCTNADLSSIGSGDKTSVISTAKASFKNFSWNVFCKKWRQFCSVVNELNHVMNWCIDIFCTSIQTNQIVLHYYQFTIVTVYK